MNPLIDNKTKEELFTTLLKLPWNKHNIQHPNLGTHLLKETTTTFIEGGGGGSTLTLLKHAILCKGKVITIDLCHAPKEQHPLPDGNTAIIGDGDYRSKKDLYKTIKNSKVGPYFEWYNEDLINFFERMRDDLIFRKKILGRKTTIDYYFDDALHHWKYLIPLFEIIIPLCSSGALIGTDDAHDENIQKFISWLKVHPKTKEFQYIDKSFFVILK